MGVPDIDERQNAVDRGLEAAERFFEPQLRKLGLTAEQIDRQSIDELRDSLRRVEDALRHPESFGTLKLRANGVGFWVVSTEHHFEVGIAPLLLERKQQVLRRLRDLGAEDVDQEGDEEVQKAMVKERAALLLRAEARERRWQLMKSVFEREFVAVTIGGVLLLILGVSLIVAMFVGVEPEPVVTNVFAVIVGFFFGATRGRDGAERRGDLDS